MMLLDDFDNSKNMYYPLDCHYDKSTSYKDWIKYKMYRDEQYIIDFANRTHEERLLRGDY